MRCPLCKEEIDSLSHIVTGTIEYRMSLDIQGDIQYETYEFEPDGNSISHYKCPDCSSVLFDKESEAVAFLKGGILCLISHPVPGT